MAGSTKNNYLQTTTENVPLKTSKAIAEHVVGGIANSALVTHEYVRQLYGELDQAASIDALRAKIATAQGGNTADIEALLLSQAIALDSIYSALAIMARTNSGGSIKALDTYLRLALKAQNQSRATLETLVTLKNPTVVIAKQANFSAGHQQVNNGPQAVAQLEKSISTQNKLLEAGHEERMDTRAAQTAGS